MIVMMTMDDDAKGESGTRSMLGDLLQSEDMHDVTMADFLVALSGLANSFVEK